MHLSPPSYHHVLLNQNENLILQIATKSPNLLPTICLRGPQHLKRRGSVIHAWNLPKMLIAPSLPYCANLSWHDRFSFHSRCISVCCFLLFSLFFCSMVHVV